MLLRFALFVLTAPLKCVGRRRIVFSVAVIARLRSQPKEQGESRRVVWLYEHFHQRGEPWHLIKGAVAQEGYEKRSLWAGLSNLWTIGTVLATQKYGFGNIIM